jgi:hypothetical protein
MSNSVRASQAVTVFGPGAVVDIGDASFVNCTVDCWASPSRNNTSHAYTQCDLRRLSTRLGVRTFWQPSTLPPHAQRMPAKSITLARFPRWLFCQVCRRMHRWSWDDEHALEEGRSPKCKVDRCGKPLIPMRWIKVCASGHMDDIDWNWTLHSGSTGCTNRSASSLLFRNRASEGVGLDALVLECSECGVISTVRDILRRVSGSKCHGRQPWMRIEDSAICTAPWQVAQRGDSNVHFAAVVSALDIPDANSGLSGPELWGDWSKLLEAFSLFANAGQPDLVRTALIFRRAEAELSIGADSIMDALERACGHDGSDELVARESRTDDSFDDIKAAEFPALSAPEIHRTPEFSGTQFAPSDADFGGVLSRMIQSVSLIHRLREVRAFRGFHRLRPGGSDRLVSAGGGRDWMPAVEVFGEGIFLRFDPAVVSEWESALEPIVRARITQLAARISESGLGYLPQPTAPLLALHAFSHALMRQLAFDCGYSASALRERLYSVGENYGILIYTAAGDSEGTLGGLVRMGEAARLSGCIGRTLREMAWCSSDPICMESTGQGVSGLNEAACHSCLLVSETSCELSNALLNRRLAIGDGQSKGLFFGALSELENSV